jgi:uncharacterized protein DUF3592
VFVYLALVAGAGLILYGLHVLGRPRKYKNWPVETALIESFSMVERGQPEVYVNIEYSIPSFGYSYLKDNTRYVGARILDNENPRNLASWYSNVDREDYQVGKSILIKVNPAEPGYSLASTTLTALQKQTAYSALSGGTICLVVAFLALF